MKLIKFLILISTLFIFAGCTTAYKTYTERINISATPKEIFDIDVELRFASVTSVEKREMKKRLGKRGLQIFTGYTRGMIQGTVIPDKKFISSIKKFIINYKPYVNSTEKEISDEVLKALEELEKYAVDA